MNKISKDYWFVVTTGILSGLIVFGGEIFKRLGFSLLELSILVYFPSIIILFPFLKGKSGQIFNGGNLKLLIMWSLFAGLTVITQFGAIMAGAPVALVVLLLYTQPIWTLFISRIFFRAEIKKVDIYALVLVVIGLVLLIQPWEIANFGSVNGTLIGLGGGLALSGWVTMGNYIGKSKIDPYVSKFMETFLEIVLITVGLVFVSRIIHQPNLVNFRLSWSAYIWLALIIWCVLTQIIGHILYLKGSKTVPAKEAGIIMLLEPVVGAILASLFLSQPITFNIAFGGALIICANVLLITNSTQREEKTC